MGIDHWLRQAYQAARHPRPKVSVHMSSLIGELIVDLASTRDAHEQPPLQASHCSWAATSRSASAVLKLISAAVQGV